jgi:hypothetical protein
MLVPASTPFVLEGVKVGVGLSIIGAAGGIKITELPWVNGYGEEKNCASSSAKYASHYNAKAGAVS